MPSVEPAPAKPATVVSDVNLHGPGTGNVITLIPKSSTVEVGRYTNRRRQVSGGSGWRRLG